MLDVIENFAPKPLCEVLQSDARIMKPKKKSRALRSL